MTLAAFIALLRRDQALRDRFVDDPRGVVREFAVDFPEQYDLPERLTRAQLDRLLADWSEAMHGFATPPAPPGPEPPPVVIYGPAPTPVAPPLNWFRRLRRFFGGH